MTKTIKTALKSGTSVRVNGSIWLECDLQPFFGPGPVQLLELIAETGSISQAAKKMNMSYKKAWGIITRLNENASSTMVLTSQGGEKGGGSSISTEAKEMIAFYHILRNKFSLFLEQESIVFK